MRKFLIVCLAATLGLLTVGPIPAQEVVPNQGTYVPEPSNRHYFGNVWVTGRFYRGTAQTDWILWFPSITSCKGDTTNLTPTRVAQFDWALGRTGTANETINIICYLNLPSRSTTSAGYKLTGFDIVSQNFQTLADATYFGARTVTYTSGSSGSIALVPVSTSIPSLSVATQAGGVFKTTGTLNDPVFLNTEARALEIEFQVKLNSSSIYYLFGIAARLTRAD